MSGYRPEFFERVSEHLRTTRGDTVVEIGGRMGDWLHGLLSYTPQVKRAFAIDPWPSRAKRGMFDVLPAWFETMKPWAFRVAFPLRGRSQDWGRVFPYRPDVVYVDGSHRYAEVLEDLEQWWPLLKRGGLLLMHDTNEMDVRRAAQKYFGTKWTQFRTESWGPGKVTTAWLIKDANDAGNG